MIYITVTAEDTFNEFWAESEADLDFILTNLEKMTAPRTLVS